MSSDSNNKVTLELLQLWNIIWLSSDVKHVDSMAFYVKSMNVLLIINWADY